MAPDSRLTLPTLVAGPTDVARLQRELASLDDYLHQAALRGRGRPSDPKLPKTSRLLDELASFNKLNFLQPADRQRAAAWLEGLKQAAPVVTISFATDPSSAFMVKLVTWLRQNIHPQLLVRTGLQPTIAAGCTLRTPNHYYDFSLRQRFSDKRALLIDRLQAEKAAEGPA